LNSTLSTVEDPSGSYTDAINVFVNVEIPVINCPIISGSTLPLYSAVTLKTSGGENSKTCDMMLFCSSGSVIKFSGSTAAVILQLDVAGVQGISTNNCPKAGII